ncbi:hypothetical protein NUW58_g4613 [Xylaria curta]|uniref:Uncharacterized protein n=1 Tax=Xylaria curta TaxID=42375 RepID=A0ACC1P7Y3_9PEZI|nr:hypothetical protein NUW58_g4613 [Xylaria curta]
MISPFALPITETTLSELDIASIVNSPGHQYDVSYNADLCFRPNLDGSQRHQANRGFLHSTLDAARCMEGVVYHTRKIHARSDMDFCREEYSARSPFWNTLQKNLQYLDYPHVAVRVAGGCVLRMLNDMKEILEALIPHRSAIINESLDIQPLMLQMFWRAEGFEECVLWLRDILKQHCAPMRHEMVNEMCITLSEGSRERDCQILVAGFKSLFSLLWTMESDVDRYNLLTSRITSLSGLASPVSMPSSSHNKRAAVSKSHPSQKSALASMRSMRTISDMAIGKPFIMALPDSGADICYISPETATSLALRPEPGAKKPAQVSKWSIPGKAMGKAITALPDSGADACYISSETAMSLGLRPEPGTKRPVKLANGRMIVSPGAVNVPWSFLREKQTFHLTCWILPGCSHPIILGSKFLEETKCLTTLRHRIRRRYVPISKSVCVNLIGEGKQRLNGFLNDDLVAALPDTGSDVMVISLDYARRRAA